MSERYRLLYLIIIMIISVSSVGGFTFHELYYTAIEGQRKWLANTARSQARLIESVARFDAKFSIDDHPEGLTAATLSQFVDAYQDRFFAGKNVSDFHTGYLEENWWKAMRYGINTDMIEPETGEIINISD